MTNNDDAMRFACERIECLAQKLGAIEASEANLMSQLEDREARLADLENKLMAMQAKEADVSRALERTRADYRELQEIQSEQYRELEQSRPDVHDLRSRLETAEQDAAEARQALARKSKRDPFEWPKDHQGNVLQGKQIQAHIDKQHQSILALRGKLKVVRANHETARHETDVLSAEVVDLRTRLRAEQEELRDCGQTLLDHRETVEQLQAEIKSRDAQIADLKSMLSVAIDGE